MNPGQEQPQQSKKHARIPPQNLDAERSVLGGILLESEAFDEVSELIKPGDFYKQAHGKVFEAMAALSARSEPIDRVTVKAELSKLGVWASLGGDDFLDLLDKVVPVSTNVSWYAKIVRDKARARRVIEAAQAIASTGLVQAYDIDEFVNDAESRIEAATSLEHKSGFVSLAGSLKEFQAQLERNYEIGSGLTGLTTGLTELDAITTGYQPGELVIIAARPSMGKTSLGLDNLRAVARAKAPNGGSAAVFSLEMPRVQLVFRLAAIEARVDLQRLRTGRLQDADWTRLADAYNRMFDLPIEIDDTARVSLQEIRAKTRRLHKKLAGTERPLRMIVVDYLQLMDHGEREGERHDQAIARTVGGLKTLAKELKITAVVLAQLNRGSERRDDHRPRPSDIRECGDVEQDADLILFPHRPHFYDKEKPEHEAEVIIGKQRNGPVGVVQVGWLPIYSSFADLELAAGQPVQSGLKFTGPRTPEPPPHDDEDLR